MGFFKSSKAIYWVSNVIGIALGILYLYKGGLAPGIVLFFLSDLIREAAHLVRLKLYAGKLEGRVSNASLGRKFSMAFLLVIMLGIELTIRLGYLENIPTVERIMIHIFLLWNTLKMSAKIKIYENGIYFLGLFCYYDEIYIAKVLENGNIKLKVDMKSSESLVLERNHNSLVETVLEKVNIPTTV